MKLENVVLAFGSLTFNGKVDEIPASVEKDGNVTVHNAGQPGRAAYFEAAFRVQGNIEVGGVSEFHIFTLTVPVVDKPAESEYAAIEGQAAKQLAPMLRLFADEIERQVVETDSNKTDNPNP